jgi:hypothetical protein
LLVEHDATPPGPVYVDCAEVNEATYAGFSRCAREAPRAFNVYAVVLRLGGSRCVIYVKLRRQVKDDIHARNCSSKLVPVEISMHDLDAARHPAIGIAHQCPDPITRSKQTVNQCRADCAGGAGYKCGRLRVGDTTHYYAYSSSYRCTVRCQS